jgi:Rrf2 family protein
MIFSKPWTYAIRALLYLAEHRNEGPILSTTIAREENIPAPFLVKILGTLSATKIVASTRGPGGGFSLERDLHKVKLIDIVSPFETVDLFQECILGLGACSDNDACPIHRRWKEPKHHLIRFLEDTTLADMARDVPTSQRKIMKSKAKV